MKRIFLAVAICIASNTAFSQMLDKYGATISAVYVNSDGNYLMQVAGVAGWLSIGNSGDPIADALYSTALAAKLSNQTNLWVRYWTNDANPGAYPSVGIISIR